jgi:hypothetical protein
MATISVTRLQLRSFLFLPPFLVATMQSRRHARESPGFIEGAMAFEWPRAFWTLTVWQDGDAMRRFRNTGAHQRAMPRLLDWCNEASYTHWDVEGEKVPAVEEAYERLRDTGQISKVNRPSAAHAARKTVSAARPLPSPPFKPGR